MLFGAVFERELAIAPRSRALYVARALYAGLLVAILATCWLVVTATQSVETVGDSARFGATLLKILAPLQMVLSLTVAAMLAAISVTSEKDRRTLEMLLVSDLSDRELVVGKLAGSLLQVVLLVFSAAPVFALAAVFGGVTAGQLVRLFVVTLAASLAAASVATAVAFWKETTFQAIAITVFLIVAWAAAGEVVRGLFGEEAGRGLSPARAVFDAIAASTAAPSSILRFLGVTGAIVLVANAIAIRWVRPWNLVQEPVRRRAAGAAHAIRTIRGNPVFWKETCTAAHGRTIVLVRLAWLLLFAAAVHGLWREVRSDRPDAAAAAIAVVPMAIASLLAVATLGVTSITTERDRGCFDLLLVSDLTPAEIVWGKLAGVLVVAREIVILPLVAAAAVAGRIATPEHAVELVVGLAVLVFFCAVLGLYVGLSHSRSRVAIAVTLGTVAFLFVGVSTAMRIMVAFSSSFELQLAPFLAVIVGGSVGLYAALAARVPSAAIGWASAMLPSLTFVAITSFLQGQPLQVFLVVVVAYGFSTAAMLVPSLGAFDAITGRSS